MLALIDADIIAMRMACKHEQHFFFPDNEYTTPDDPPAFIVKDLESAQKECDEFIAGLCIATGTFEYLLCFTGSNNFRKRVMPTYKGNRKDKLIPELRAELMNYMKSKHHYKQREGLEADDLMGIIQTKRNSEGYDSIICTIDKDLRQIPGLHYNWNSQKTTEVSDAEGLYLHYFQTLIGDTTDGYKGCPGCGPVKAKKVLSGLDLLTKKGKDEAWKRIVKTYEEKELTEEDALQNARVAYMLQDEDFDRATGEVLLWVPNSKLENPRLKL